MHLSNKLSFYSGSLLCKLLSAFITNLWTKFWVSKILANGHIGCDLQLKIDYLIHMGHSLLLHLCNSQIQCNSTNAYNDNGSFSREWALFLLWFSFSAPFGIWGNKLGNDSRDFKLQENIILQNKGLDFLPQFRVADSQKKTGFPHLITYQTNLTAIRILVSLETITSLLFQGMLSAETIMFFRNKVYKQETKYRQNRPCPAIHM